MMDLVLKNARVVTPFKEFNGWVAVRGERIAAMGDNDDPPRAERVIDCQGKALIPGVVEPHTHLGVSGRATHAEEVQSETAVATLGGITVVFEHLRRKDNLYREIMPSIIDEVSPILHVDFGFHLGITKHEHCAEIPECAERWGLRSYKLNIGGYGKEQNPYKAVVADNALIYDCMVNAASITPQGIVMTHCEDVALVDHFIRVVRDERGGGSGGLKSWNEARPPFCEDLDMRRAARLAKLTGAKWYVPHTTIDTGPGIAADCYREGTQVVLETCPQYLYLTCEDPYQVGALGKVNPPIRPREHVEAIWEGIKNGLVRVIGTDHVPLEKGGKSIWEELPGFLGMQVLLPIMISEGIHKRGLTLRQVVEICCYNPARTFYLYPRKGTIEVGSDADLTLIDMELEAECSDEWLQTKVTNVYKGIRFKGWPVVTVCRGSVVMENREIVGKPGWGKCVQLPGDDREPALDLSEAIWR
ncbi:MAG: amidohydrolase family protein [Firmicutes bacterium]|nr:amidohydrolase family protein [Bacillota bacterium]